ncbi:MAG: hypothetical protein ACMG6E_03375 [Candidatus Roizmanbacteria bacterium]
MVVVQKKNGETTEKLMKRFSRLTKDEDIVFYAGLKKEHKNHRELKEAKKRMKIQKRKNASWHSSY